MSYKDKVLKEYADIPYTMVGMSTIPDSYGITLTGKGIKAIAEKLKDNDLLKIDIFRNKWVYTICIHEEKELEEIK